MTIGRFSKYRRCASQGALACTLVLALGCAGAGGGRQASEGATPEGTDGSPASDASMASGSSTDAGRDGAQSAPDDGPGGDAMGTPGNAPEGGPDRAASPLLPARIRRLTNAEYDASVQALLGTSMKPSAQFAFPADTRQGPSNSPAGAAFTRNDAQRVDPVLASKLDAAAQALVTEAREQGKLTALAPCPDPGGDGEACAEAFLRSFGAAAYRRPLTDEEVDSLVLSPSSPYHVGADGHSHEDGIDLIARVLLQAPGFLYVTELGEPRGGGTVVLTASEVAAQLSYLLTGQPPDRALLDAVAAGALATPAGRETEARRLLATPEAQARLVHVIQEWLGISEVTRREKAVSVYPEFSTLSAAMEAESYAFIDEVLQRSSGTLTELLTADWTIADAQLAELYGVDWAGAGARTSLAGVGRSGILNQAAFLSVFATNNGSHPIYRGVAMMRRIACLDTPDPGALGIVVNVPPADPTKTTRERFAVHSTDPSCAGCHASIDAFGNSLENFDGIGRARETDNDRPVDTSVDLAISSELDGSYADSAELLSALAESQLVRSCFARQLFRSAAAHSGADVAGAEDAFIEVWEGLPEAQQERPADLLVAFVKSAAFVERRTP